MTDLSTLAKRLLNRDYELWPKNSVAPNRLGWLDVPKLIASQAKEITSWADGIEQDQVVLLGMGGSSLGPAVLESVLSNYSIHSHKPRPNRRKLNVLDTTDPSTIASTDFENSFMIVSSKSGSTLEVHTLLSYAMSREIGPKRYCAITDPGTELETLASEKGFSKCWINPSDIGGRYSVMSYFGMIPAALIGYDVEELSNLALDCDIEEAVALGHDMGTQALAGRDKVTIQVAKNYSSFGLWVEQIIAESTGKLGKGCIPVPTTLSESGEDRLHVNIELTKPSDLANQFYRWELATPIAGHVLQIDPFDEPNVAESKHNTNEVLGALPLTQLPTNPPKALGEFLTNNIRQGDYVSIQAYLPFGQDESLEALRTCISQEHNSIAVTAGYGPRFLHSTGQLHKGGPNSIIAIQLVPANSEPVVEIPNYPYDFATLKAAQSIGDFKSLQSHERRVLRIAVEAITEKGDLI